MDELNKYYTERWNKKEEWHKIGPTKAKRLQNLLNFIESNFNDKEKISLIDYGCGSGWLFHFLNEYGIKNLYGFDVTTETLSLIKEKYPYVKGLWSNKNGF